MSSALDILRSPDGRIALDALHVALGRLDAVCFQVNVLVDRIGLEECDSPDLATTLLNIAAVECLADIAEHLVGANVSLDALGEIMAGRARVTRVGQG